MEILQNAKDKAFLKEEFKQFRDEEYIENMVNHNKHKWYMEMDLQYPKPYPKLIPNPYKKWFFLKLLNVDLCFDKAVIPLYRNTETDGKVGEDVMDIYTVFFALIVMLYPARFMKQTRDNLLYPNRTANRLLVYIGGIVCIIIIQGFMIMWHLELAEQFSRRDVVPTCYMYVMLNVVAQILIYKKADRETSDSRYTYFEWIWMAGVALYSVVFIVALRNLEHAFAWLVGAGVIHTLYNLGYFFFLYFTEKELMRTRIWPEKLKSEVMQSIKSDIVSNVKSSLTPDLGVNRRPDMAINMELDKKFDMNIKADANRRPNMVTNAGVNGKFDMNVNAGVHRKFDMKTDTGIYPMSDKKLLPLHRVYGEDYRKRKLERVRDKNIAAMALFCMMGGSYAMFVLMILWMENVPLAMPMTIYCVCSFFAGMVYLACCWVKSKRNVKYMRIETAYEGVAQVTMTRPLTVQYSMPNEGMVTRRVSSEVKNIFEKGMFVKIVVENGTIIEAEPTREITPDVWRAEPWMPYKGQRFGKETGNALRVVVIAMVIGLVGWGYCFFKYPYMVASTPENRVHEEFEYEKPRMVSQETIMQQWNFEEEILKCLEKDVDEFLRWSFPDVDDTVLENVREICTKKVKSIQNLANYGIVERETRDYEKYTVKMEIVPSYVFQTLQDNLEEVSREKMESEIYEDGAQMYVDIVEESIKRSIEGNTYGDKQMIEVVVTVSGDECEMDEAEWKKMFETIFPQ